VDYRIEDKARKVAVIVGLLLSFLAQHAVSAPEQKNAKEAKTGGDAKMISGMSIVGNTEAPKSLFIVPWKSSEIGSETNLTSGLLDDSLRPVDKEVFMREMDFFEITHTN